MATILTNPPAKPAIRLRCPLCGFTVLSRSNAAAVEAYVAHVERVHPMPSEAVPQ